MAAAPPPKSSLVAIVTLSVGQDCGCEELRRCFLQIVDAVPRLQGELTELNSMFQSLDTNEDGQLSLEEIVDGMEGRFTLLREEVEQLVEAADLNLDGEPPPPVPCSSRGRIIGRCDANGRGGVCATGLVLVRRFDGEGCWELTDDPMILPDDFGPHRDRFG